MLDRLLPKQVDNRFNGYRAALWFLGAFVALKVVMSVRTVFDTAAILSGDGIAIDSFAAAAAEQVLLLFALMGLSQLMLALIALTILVRYRALVPLICLLLLAERIAARLIIQSHSGAGGDNAIVWVMAVTLPTLLALALVLSLIPVREDQSR